MTSFSECGLAPPDRRGDADRGGNAWSVPCRREAEAAGRRRRGWPVLPLRFGTVMATRDAVAGELLAVYQEAFAAALRKSKGAPST